MRKYIIASCVMALLASPSWGLSLSDVTGGTYWVNPEVAGFDDCMDLNYETGNSYGEYTPSSTCRTNWSKWISERKKVKKTTNGGVVTYSWPILYVTCPVNDQIHCETYDGDGRDGNSYTKLSVCASGYYGDGTTCTKCPANATCSGEGNTTFSCNSGYCKSGTSCTARPANSTCSGNTFSCNAGYYRNGTSCTKCPTPGTSTSGATSITQCYVTSGTDGSGSFSYTGKCNYTN